jgi:hypothetical protein
MRHSRKLRLGAILALGATAAVTLAAAASAGQVFRETVHEEDTLVLGDFVGVQSVRAGQARRGAGRPAAVAVRTSMR